VSASTAQTTTRATTRPGERSDTTVHLRQTAGAVAATVVRHGRSWAAYDVAGRLTAVSAAVPCLCGPCSRTVCLCRVGGHPGVGVSFATELRPAPTGLETPDG